MAEVIIVEGPSGSGKSASLRNMPIAESFIITPNSKPLPFKGGNAAWGKRKMLVEQMEKIPGLLDQLDKKPEIKYVIIEDFSHYFHNRIMSPSFMASSSGNQTFERWKILARDVMEALFFKAKHLRADLKIIILHHIDTDAEGKETFKIFGKLLGDSLDPVSYVRIVWHTRVLHENEKPEERYVIQTNDDGVFQAKSPMGMFTENFIPNDLYAAIQIVEEYDKPETKTA